MARSKYRNVKTEIDGMTFDSKREAGRYVVLKGMLQAGEIVGLEMQPKYKIVVNGVLVCRYNGDFRYTDAATGAVVVEDAKGFKTQVYRLKKKLLKAVFGIDISEV